MSVHEGGNRAGVCVWGECTHEGDRLGGLMLHWHAAQLCTLLPARRYPEYIVHYNS